MPAPSDFSDASLERVIPRVMPLNDHVILCGLGELGLRTLERLRALGKAVAVMEPSPKPEFERQLAEWKIPLYRESGKDPAALRRAGALTAGAVIAATDDDLTNLAIALTAREENPDIRLVVRLFNPRLVEKVERDLPHCRVLDVAALAAPVFALAGIHDDILHCVDLPGRRYLLRQWRGAIPPDVLVVAIERVNAGFQAQGVGGLGFAIAGRPEWDFLPANTHLGPQDVAYGLSRSDEPAPDRRASDSARAIARRWQRELRRRCTALATNPLAPVMLVLLMLAGVSAELFRETLHLSWLQAVYFVVTILTTTGFGDISLRNASPQVIVYGTGLMLVGAMLMAVLYASLTDSLLSMRLASILGRRPMAMRDHFVICGFGTVGFRIAEELVALGHPTVAIEKQEHSRLVEQARRKGVNVLLTPDIYSTFSEVHLEDARCVLTVTDDDAVNLELGIMAEEANPLVRVVMRMFDPHMASLVERTFGIHLARSPSVIAAPAFAVAASADDLLDAFDLGDTLWCVGRLTLHDNHHLAGLTLKQLSGKGILLLSLTRAGQTAFEPAIAFERLEVHDELVIVTPHANWLALEE